VKKQASSQLPVQSKLIEILDKRGYTPKKIFKNVELR
jgi:broad-specificity NMP kinase